MTTSKINTKQELKRIIALEEKIYKKKWYYDLPVKLTENQQLYKFMKKLRKAEYAVNTNKFYRHISLLKLNRFEMKYGMSVPLNVLGEGFWMNHLGSLIINVDAKIGKNVSLNPGVCIGGNKGKAPVIGDNVFFGPGAKVFGDVTIADDVQIGANAVVTKSCLKKGALLVGEAARIK